MPSRVDAPKGRAREFLARDLAWAVGTNVLVFGAAWWTFSMTLPVAQPEVPRTIEVSASFGSATSTGGGDAGAPEVRAPAQTPRATPAPIEELDGSVAPNPSEDAALVPVDTPRPTSSRPARPARSAQTGEAVQTDTSPGDADTGDTSGDPAPTPSSAAAPSGEGGGTQGGSLGPGDPLAARTIALYRGRLVSWFSARFRVTGSGLSPQELTRHVVRAEVTIGDDLTVTGYEILSVDHPAFEAAARKALESTLHHSLPPPPTDYPGEVQRRLSLTFKCSERTCS